jgi:hypothetical protein
LNDFATLGIVPVAILLCALAVHLRAMPAFAAIIIAGAATWFGSPYLALVKHSGAAMVVWVLCLAVLAWAAARKTRL